MLRDLHVHTCLLYCMRSNYTLAISCARTIWADDHQARDAVAPRDTRPQRLLLRPVTAVPE